MKGTWPQDAMLALLVLVASALSAPLLIEGAFADVPQRPPLGAGAPVKVAPVKVTLGDAATIATLFAWPNNNKYDNDQSPISFQHQTPHQNQTRAGNAAHYLRQSLRRDGLRGASVRVQAAGGQYVAVLRHVPPGYGARIGRFLQIGEQGADATAALKQSGKWQAQWRFFLPLGLPLANQRAVQLLHFPPDTSLQQQDYLDSNTSRRWETLLRLNGAPARGLARYERIVDIAPVAAPADAGASLASTYDAYQDYARAMLADAITPKASQVTAPMRGSHPLPVLAYGAPVRDWVRQYLGARLRVSAAPVYVRLGKLRDIPMLGANHPSLFWYVAKKSRTAAARVMRDDLVAACWQLKMGAQPARRIRRTLGQCARYWDDRPFQVCEQTEVQGYGKTAHQARRICAKSARRMMHAAHAMRPAELRRFERAGAA